MNSIRIDSLLTLTVLGLVLVGCFWVLQPFMTAIVFAVILTIAGWPLFTRLRTWFGGRSGWAALVMVLLVSSVVLTPFLIVGATIADNLEHIRNLMAQLIKNGPPALPKWVAGLPLVGTSLMNYWNSITHDTGRLLQELYRMSEPMKNVVLSGGGDGGQWHPATGIGHRAGVFLFS